MNQYRRIVSYLYKYETGKKGESTGYLRIDTRPEGIRLYIRIKDLRMMDEKRIKVYFYFHKENRLQLFFVDEFLCVRGICEYKKDIVPDFTDADFDKINGVVFMDEQGLLYGSCWDEYEISNDLFEESQLITGEMLKEKPVIGREMLEEKSAIRDELLEQEQVIQEELFFEREGETQPLIENQEQNAELRETEYGSMLSDYPEILFDDSENSIYAVQIQMEDIPKLPSSEWKLADNVFLKRAYEAESHLLLGKIQMSENDKIWVLGVPGIYDNREKYIAGIFGFMNYIPLEMREYKTGGRGYWIREIAPIE